MNTVFALIARIHGTYASKSTMVGMCVLIVPKGGETMKKRKKLNFWRLLPKTAPYILALMFWRYSNLNAEQTIMIIIVCVIFYALCIASAEAWVSTEKRKD
jgi:uncharacterized membrane protein